MSLKLVTGTDATTRSIVRAITELALTGHLYDRAKRIDTTWEFGEAGLACLTVYLSPEEVEAARTLPDMVQVPIIGTTREEHPRDAVSHAPNTCDYYHGEEEGRCLSPIGWAAGSSRVYSGWHHLDPEITDHQAVPTV